METKIDSEKRKTALKWAHVDNIRKNPNNPRQRFPQASIDTLAKSIKKEGVLVPLLVYEKDDEFILLDGERRLRAAKQINEEYVPVNIVKEPSDKQNVLKMFEIHTQREEWDIISMAWSIEKLIEIIEPGNKPHDILSDSDKFSNVKKKTGLTKKILRDCLIILTFPKNLQDRVFEKDIKPAYLTEMYPLLEAYKEYQPEVYKQYGREGLIRAIIEKVDARVIKNAANQFRKLTKVVKGEEIGAPKDIVSRISEDILTKLEMTVESAYDRTIKATDIVSDIRTRSDELILDLTAFTKMDKSDIKLIELINSLEELKKAISEVLNKLRF